LTETPIFGRTVQHRSRIANNPGQPNLRQVHLIHAELFDELAEQGVDVEPGDMGENIAARGIDLLRLPQYAELWIGFAPRDGAVAGPACHPADPRAAQHRANSSTSTHPA